MTNEGKPYFPLFVDLSNQKIIVIGAGKIAKRRIKILSQFTSKLTVVGISADREVKGLANEGKVILHERAYRSDDLKDSDIAIIATNNKELNEEIWAICKKREILVNVASDKNKCDFHFPGIIKKENLVIGINAGGYDHAKAKSVRQEIERSLEEKEETI